MSISQKELNNRKSIVWFGSDCCMTYEDAYTDEHNFEYSDKDLENFNKDAKKLNEKWKKEECCTCGEKNEDCECLCNECGKKIGTCGCLPF